MLDVTLTLGMCGFNNALSARFHKHAFSIRCSHGTSREGVLLLCFFIVY